MVEFDDILKRRKTPDVPDGLSARIIAAAHRVPQNTPQGEMDVTKPARSRNLWDELFGWMAIPKPALVVAMLILLVLGAGLGVEYSGEIGEGLNTEQMASYLSIEDRFVVGDWV